MGNHTSLNVDVISKAEILKVMEKRYKDSDFGYDQVYYVF